MCGHGRVVAPVPRGYDVSHNREPSRDKCDPVHWLGTRRLTFWSAGRYVLDGCGEGADRRIFATLPTRATAGTGPDRGVRGEPSRVARRTGRTGGRCFTARDSEHFTSGHAVSPLPGGVAAEPKPKHRLPERVPCRVVLQQRVSSPRARHQGPLTLERQFS
jgi:hypothetical protein